MSASSSDLPLQPAESRSSNDQIVRVRGVSKRFGDRTVLKELDLDVRVGEKVALIGPSGSGKTTILRMLVGLERPDAGTIDVAGHPLWHRERNGRIVDADERHVRSVRRNVGMVFQHYNLFPHMTALENVMEAPIHVLKQPRAEARRNATDLLALVGLGDHLDHRPSQMSGGQQQRVGIARAMALQPRVMLFDEVTSALDPELVGEVLSVIRELAAKSDMAMLLVTHEMSFAAQISDRVLMFDGGCVIEEGAPDVVLRNPRQERTRRFLSAVLDRG